MTRQRRAAAGGVGTLVAIGLALVVAVPLLAGAAAAGLLATVGFGDAGGSAAAISAGGEVSSPPVPVKSDPLPLLSRVDLTWPWGQCTWYVAQHRQVSWRGNAADWLWNAAAHGIATARAPTLGAIVVFRRVRPYSTDDGHVALVIAVTPTSYSIAEMNFIGSGRIDVRTIGWPDPAVQGFVP